MSHVYDYIVVGAGSAGAILAARLAELQSKTVLLVEAGPVDKSMWIRIPAGISRLLSDEKLTWQYWSEQEPYLKGRKLYWPRGRTIGGTGAINGLSYLRGQPRDYQEWRQLGCTGWDWDSVLPVYKRIEDYWGEDSEFHSGRGGIRLTSLKNRVTQNDSLKKATEVFIEGAVEAGIPVNDDFNGRHQEGVGWIDHNIDDRGRRHSSADAFLKPAMKRDNLTIWTEAVVEHIRFSDRRAIGVQMKHLDQSKSVDCRCEIILCAGSINSPQTLMLSGIGPADHLSQHGIEVLVDSPNVGQNLQDHTYLHWVHEVKPGYSINSEIRGPGLIKHVLRYYLSGMGILTTGSSSAYLFTKVMPGVESPDMQIAFRPMSDELFVSGTPGPHYFPGWSASVCYLRPKSRGHIRLKGPDPAIHPAILGNYLQHDDDLEAMKIALRLVDKIYSSPKFNSVLERRLVPEEELNMSDERQMEEFIRGHTSNMHHPVGTCAMGGSETSVVDPELRVRGVEGLRVADASVMPVIVSGNTNAAAIMIGAKAAELISRRS